MIRDTVRHLRLKYGWIQKEMADVIGTKREAYCRKERGASHFASHELVRLLNFFRDKINVTEMENFTSELKKEGHLKGSPFIDPPPPEADTMEKSTVEMFAHLIKEFDGLKKECVSRLDLIESHLGIKKTSSNGNSY